MNIHNRTLLMRNITGFMTGLAIGVALFGSLYQGAHMALAAYQDSIPLYQRPISAFSMDV